jgi:hypothetical protein
MIRAGHARGETEDASWVFVPEIKAAFVRDLIISGFPNIGNPFKPTCCRGQTKK